MGPRMQATGISRRAMHAGLDELAAQQSSEENLAPRIRQAGGGRKSVTDTATGGWLRWTCKSSGIRVRGPDKVMSHLMFGLLVLTADQ